MALDTITIALSVRRDVSLDLSGGEALRACLRAIDTWFRLLEVSGSLGPTQIHIVDEAPHNSWRGIPLWPGERADDTRSLTEVPRDEAGVSPRLLELVRPDEPEVSLALRGALYHTPPQGGASGWYGRMLVTRPGVTEGALWELGRLDLQWQPPIREVTLHLSIAGYPLTRQVPLLDQERRVQSTHDLRTVEENRERLFSGMASLRQAFGLGREDCFWEINWEDALDPGDKEALRFWQDRLMTGEGES